MIYLRPDILCEIVLAPRIIDAIIRDEAVGERRARKINTRRTKERCRAWLYDHGYTSARNSGLQKL